MSSLKRQGVAALVVALMLCAVAVPSAGAAKFSSTSLKLTASGLTVDKKGAEAKTCTGAPTFSVSESSSTIFGLANLSCGSGLWLGLAGSAVYNATTGEYTYNFQKPNGPLQSPWGWYNTEAMKATWINGSALTPSVLKFNKALIGRLQTDFSSTINLNGTFTATTSSGGLITLSP